MIKINFTETIDVLRKNSTASLDEFGNPNYGLDSNWTIIYSNIKSKISLLEKAVVFERLADIIQNDVIMFINPEYVLKVGDMIKVKDSTVKPELDILKDRYFFIQKVVPIYLFSKKIHHLQCYLKIPT